MACRKAGREPHSRGSPTCDSWQGLPCRPTQREEVGYGTQDVTEGLLAEGYAFYHDRWERGVVRFASSFATTERDVDHLVEAVVRHTT